jgi:hypothetical protein
VTEEGGREERKRKPWGEDKKKKEGIEKRKKKKREERKGRKNRKNKLSIFLEIVIHNLYVLSTPRF